MKSKLFCVRDQKVGVYADPFPCPTVEAALRSMETAVQGGNGDISKYPQDFDLYEVATFDPETGLVVALTAPKHVTSALAFKPVAKPQQVRDDISL